mmetsp:Transcript_56916/g.101577  ORF Transcript_56916/g.101577 Transcript_56916/m.101577 type:complete len:140 (-) Transcript_56916:2395-2814(-)
MGLWGEGVVMITDENYDDLHSGRPGDVWKVRAKSPNEALDTGDTSHTQMVLELVHSKQGGLGSPYGKPFPVLGLLSVNASFGGSAFASMPKCTKCVGGGEGGAIIPKGLEYPKSKKKLESLCCLIRTSLEVDQWQCDQE